MTDVPAPGSRYGGWLVDALDGTAKRARVHCAACKFTLLVSCEALADGSLKRCACSTRPSSRIYDQPETSFARGVTELELSTSGKGRYHP